MLGIPVNSGWWEDGSTRTHWLRTSTRKTGRIASDCSLSTQCRIEHAYYYLPAALLTYDVWEGLQLDFASGKWSPRFFLIGPRADDHDLLEIALAHSEALGVCNPPSTPETEFWQQSTTIGGRSSNNALACQSLASGKVLFPSRPVACSTCPVVFPNRTQWQASGQTNGLLRCCSAPWDYSMSTGLRHINRGQQWPEP